MSRIHDALRRAEQERATKAASTDIVEVGPGPNAPASSLLDLPDPSHTVPRVPPSKTERPLTFDVVAAKCAHPQWDIDPLMTVFGAGEDGSEGAERFRTLRSRLHQISATHSLRRVLVSSSVPAEGKSFIASNLAQSIAYQQESRVLLIDADLRASRLHLALGAPKSPGLTNCLRGETDAFSVIQIAAQKNFAFVPAGDLVSDPSELILGGQMKKFLDRVTPAFDWVILDSPPALAVHDASLLADLCDGVLFVIKAGGADFESAIKASSEFQSKNLLGVVLNQVEPADMYTSYSYYQYGGEKPKSN
jgi:protein-tyrosine kinase